MSIVIWWQILRGLPEIHGRRFPSNAAWDGRRFAQSPEPPIVCACAFADRAALSGRR